MPSSDYLHPPEAQEETLAWSINQEITAFIADHPGINLQTLSEMLGATKFFKLIPSKSRDSSAIQYLNVSEFVEALKAQHHLHAINMPETIATTDDTFLPPDPGEIATGSGQGIEIKVIIPRTRYLIEVLTELHLSYSVHEGRNTPNMLRQLSYQAFEVPEKGLVILINNEEGNATFIVHHVEENNQTNNWKHFSQFTKDQLKALGQDKVTVIIFNQPAEEWKREIAHVIVSGQTDKKPHKPTTLPDDNAKPELKHRTAESALQELEEAFKKWQELSEETRGRFNSNWLKKNGFEGLYNWCKIKTSEGRAKNIPLGVLVARSSNQELKNSFEKREQEEPYTDSSALAKLEEAFKKWQELPEETRGKLNSNWLEKNGFGGLYNWCKIKTSEGGAKNIPLGVLVARSSNIELKNSFEKREKEKPYTDASALAKLEEAFKKWQELSEETRGRFNSNWLEKNGFGGLYNWCKIKTSEG
ncbi:MAG: hypothetical protein HY981_01110, partial [Candidatus Magasanikbacteria bacterium]|nr:hypothetical protein [Candidatus Magasanikbacteria bacterium]